MTDEELNNFIHEMVMGVLCKHNSLSQKKSELLKCDDCDYRFEEDEDFAIPNYCQSLDAVAVPEAKAIKKFGFDKYFLTLTGRTKSSSVISYEERGRHIDGMNASSIFTILAHQLKEACTATARQRAEAIYKCYPEAA